MSKIKVKTFVSSSCNILHHGKLDERINDFIANNSIEVVDIKFSTAVGGENGSSWYPSALLIYKEICAE